MRLIHVPVPPRDRARKNTLENRSMVVLLTSLSQPVSVNASLRKFGKQKQSRALCACKSVRVCVVRACLYAHNKPIVFCFLLYSSAMSVSRRVL